MEMVRHYFASWDLIYLGIFFIVFIPSLMMDINKHEHATITPQERAKDGVKWTLIWAGISTLFGVFTWGMLGPELGMAYFTGWALEKSLALDNLFAIMAIMSSFGLLAADKVNLQYKILHWGILGAIFFRMFFLATGAFFVNLPTVSIFNHEVNIVMAIFALVILWTVHAMWTEMTEEEDDDIDYTKHWSVNAVKHIWPVEPSINTGKFFVTRLEAPTYSRPNDARKYVTPLFLCLVCVEVFDIIFSFDSMPIIVAVVKDPNVMIASTLMACAGLRAFYFCIDALKSMFVHLDKAIIAILLFIVGKLLAVSVGFHISNVFSLSVVAGLILVGVIASKVWPEEEAA